MTTISNGLALGLSIAAAVGVLAVVYVVTKAAWHIKEWLLQIKPRGIEEYDDLLSSIWLYVGWREVTRHLTTEQRELWAEAITRHSRQEFPDDPTQPERWWTE